jgi:hypothetical protein
MPRGESILPARCREAGRRGRAHRRKGIRIPYCLAVVDSIRRNVLQAGWKSVEAYVLGRYAADGICGLLANSDDENRRSREDACEPVAALRSVTGGRQLPRPRPAQRARSAVVLWAKSWWEMQLGQPNYRGDRQRTANGRSPNRLNSGGLQILLARSPQARRRLMDRSRIVTWLILPVVICLSQRLSHACLSISNYTVKLRMAH